MSREKICTWRDCEDKATHAWDSKDGQVWANLCDLHHKKLDEALSEGNPKLLMNCYVKAQGGAENAAKRMMGD